MGQIKPIVSYFFASLIGVSIPIWCDSNKKKKKAPTLVRMFQFQYGAIQTCATLLLSGASLVSIPTWCD
jgi:hypothetical protein